MGDLFYFSETFDDVDLAGKFVLEKLVFSIENFNEEFEEKKLRKGRLKSIYF